MSLLKTTFSKLKSQNKTAFIPFITAGDGGLDTTYALMQILVKNGADVIELGVPFSDPMADGPIIAASHQRAIMAGVSLHDVLALVQKFKQNFDSTAVVLMGYLNPIETFGYQAFAHAAQNAGVDGVVVVDMPAEESADLYACLREVDIDFIFLIAPTTTEPRLKFLATICSGFVYFVSLKGVTGAGYLNIDDVSANIAIIRKYIDLPLGVGFGIKNAKDAKAVSAKADAVIVGSSFVAFIEKYATNKDKMLKSVGALALAISTAIN